MHRIFVGLRHNYKYYFFSMSNINKARFDFEQLPAFARFILDGHMEEFVRTLLDLSREFGVPTLKYFDHLSEQELFELSLNSNTAFLKSLINSKAIDELELSLKEWKNLQFDFVAKEQIQLEDLLLMSYLRKRAFCSMMKSYTTEADLLLKLVDELDAFFISFDRSTTHSYVRLLKTRIEEDIYFREKLAGTSPGFSYIYDIRNNCQVQASAKLFSYLGYEPDEFIGDSEFFTKIVHPEDHVAAAPYLERIKNGTDGEVHFFEYRLLSKDNEYKWMRNYESIYKRDQNGEAIQLIGIAFDISKERSVRNELVSREEDLLEAQELSNMGSYIWHLQNGPSFRTPQTNKILGLDESEDFSAFLTRIHPADKAIVSAAIDKAIAGEGEFETEYRCIADGSDKIVWGKGKVNFANGKPHSIKGTVMDVTDKHHMVQKLKRSESLYKQAESLNKLGNWTWEIKTGKLEWSDELFRIYGLEPQSEKLSFERFISFIHPEDKEERIKKLEEQMTHTQLSDYYFRIIAADGKYKILYGQSRVLADENGVPFKMIGTCQDVTQQKELENILYQKTIQLERSNAYLEDFAFISSHDLKEPLRKISVFGDKLRLTQQELQPEGRNALDKMIDAARRMQQMVDELLSLSLITSDHSFHSCSLERILKDVLQTMEEKIAECNGVIEHDHLPQAFVNELQFQQLFENLVSNALKFRKAGVQPVIRITHQRLGKDEIELLKLDPLKKYLRIDINDNGIGFEESAAEKIFTIFQRLNGAQYEGTGIGLAICKKIVEHHDGLIFAAAGEKQGAKFSVVIPEK